MFKHIQRILGPALMLVPFSTAWSLEMVNDDGSVWEASQSSALHWEPEVRGIGTDLPIESFASLKTWPEDLDFSELIPVPVPVVDTNPDVAERVIGTDNRKRVKNTRKSPARYSGALVINSSGLCTGELFGPRVIQTAAHCLVDDNGQRVSPGALLFAAGAYRSSSGTPIAPYGLCKGVSSTLPSKYITLRKNRDPKQFNFDWALVKLDCTVGDRTGYFGFKARSRRGQNTNIWGYPGDKPFPTQWKHSCNLIGVTKKQIAYRCDTAGGQSGSGVWKKFSGCGRCLFGVHTFGGASNNGGTRLKRAHIRTMKTWRRM